MHTERRPVVVVGSINIDLVATTERIPVEGETVAGSDFQIHPGGKGANQAVAVARLGYPVQLIGRVGGDAFGGQLLQHLEAAGVDASGVMVSEGSSGVAVIAVAKNGQNSIVIVPGANALVTPDDLEANIDRLRAAGMVLTQLEVPLATVEHLAGICSREGIPLMLDPAPAQTLPSDLYKAVDWFTPNETEAAFFLADESCDGLAGEPRLAAGLLMEKGAKGVVLKMGSRGAYLASCGGFEAWVEAFPVKAVDTTAAGDCFNGAFATGLQMGMAPVDAARFAAAAAALSVTRAAAQPSMPTLAEVRAMLGEG